MKDSSTAPMRDTEYAREITSATVADGDNEIRVERLYIKALNSEEIRFSWWQSGKMIPRPPDLPEDQLLQLLANAIANKVFSTEFLVSLKALL